MTSTRLQKDIAHKSVNYKFNTQKQIINDRSLKNISYKLTFEKCR